MERPAFPVFVVALVASTAALAADRTPGSVDIALFRDGVEVEVASAESDGLVSDVLAYVGTCRTIEAVTGETPSQDSLLETWQEHARGSHALLTLGGAPGDAASGPPRLLLGFSAGSPAWPVLSRDPDGQIVLYAKCDGLRGALLACEMGELLPGTGPRDCERLREIRQRAVDDEERAVTPPRGDRRRGALGRRRVRADRRSGRRSSPPASPPNPARGTSLFVDGPCGTTP